jgi:hypothetical protein
MVRLPELQVDQRCRTNVRWRRAPRPGTLRRVRISPDSLAPPEDDRSLAAAVRRAGGGQAVDPRPAHAARVIEILARERRSRRTARRRTARRLPAR